MSNAGEIIPAANDKKSRRRVAAALVVVVVAEEEEEGVGLDLIIGVRGFGEAVVGAIRVGEAMFLFGRRRRSVDFLRKLK